MVDTIFIEIITVISTMIATIILFYYYASQKRMNERDKDIKIKIKELMKKFENKKIELRNFSDQYNRSIHREKVFLNEINTLKMNQKSLETKYADYSFKYLNKKFEDSKQQLYARKFDEIDNSIKNLEKIIMDNINKFSEKFQEYKIADRESDQKYWETKKIESEIKMSQIINYPSKTWPKSLTSIGLALSSGALSVATYFYFQNIYTFFIVVPLLVYGFGLFFIGLKFWIDDDNNRKKFYSKTIDEISLI